jgi:hypothetical protein
MEANGALTINQFSVFRLSSFGISLLVTGLLYPQKEKGIISTGETPRTALANIPLMTLDRVHSLFAVFVQ